MESHEMKAGSQSRRANDGIRINVDFCEHEKKKNISWK